MSEYGTELGPGNIGELCLRGRDVLVMTHLNRSDIHEVLLSQSGCNENVYTPSSGVFNCSTLRNGWLHTGDIATYSEDGFFWFLDRKKELLKYDGYQIAPGHSTLQ